MFGLKKNGILDPEGKYKNPLTGDNYSEQYFETTHFWSNLPVYKDGNAERLIKVIKNNRVMILESGTGSGKTVLIPKYCLHVLDYKGKVMVTVPKQVNAKSSAVRDAKWMDVILGEEVGYKYRGAHLNEQEALEKGGDASPESPSTKLLFATGGSLVSILSRDQKLSEYDIVVIDEAHERSVEIDESLLYMRRALRLNSKLKLIVMSATLPNSATFLEYFGDFNPAHEQFSGAPNKHVDIHYLGKGIKLKTADEIGAEALRIIFEEIVNKNETGDILVFVNSKPQGETLQRIVQNRYPNIFTTVLARGTSQEQENYATEEYDYKEYKRGRPKDGWVRKIIFATNVAESSMTFKGLKYVIDSGTELKAYYNAEKQQSILKNQMITRAQADQRKGRVGRNFPGVCYRLYTEKDFEKMKEKPETTIVDADMTYNFLKYLTSPEIKGSLLKMVQFVQELIEPPPLDNIQLSIRNMISLSLIPELSKSAVLTQEGKLVSEISFSGKLPDIYIGKAILAGRYYGCEKKVIILSAIRTVITRGIQDLFFSKTKDPRFKEVLKEYHHSYGDLFSFYKVYIQYHKHSLRMDRRELETWAKGEFLNLNVLERIQETAKTTYNGIRNILEKVEILEDYPFKNDDEASLFSLIKGYFFNIVKLDKKSGKKITYTNFYPPIKTTASYDTRGNSFLSLGKPPKYMFYISNHSMNGNVTFMICNVCPEDLIKVLRPEELLFLNGIKF